MSEFDKMLEDVAREWDLHACGDDACELEGADCLAEYLKRRLLGLLEAGQAMEKLLRRYSANDHVHGGCDELTQETEDFLEAWDKQKQAAMEGR